MCSQNHVSVWKLIYCVTTTVTKQEKKSAKLRVKCWKCSVESVLGVAVQSLSLVVSLSNEALWSRGSHPSLGPHTSLMFPHHSPDNYRGRECHLSRASSTEDDSTRSVVCQTCHECVAISHGFPARSHTHTHTLGLSTHSQTYRFYPKWTICVLLSHSQHTGCLTSLALFQQAAQLFFIDTEQCLCVQIKACKEKRISSLKL